MAAMPSARASAGVMCGTSRPATVSRPASGRSAPVMILISVDLPAPFSLTIACTSPACRSNETWRSALTPSNDLVMDDAERSAGGKRQDDSGIHADGTIMPHDERKGRKGREDEFFSAVFALAKPKLAGVSASDGWRCAFTVGGAHLYQASLKPNCAARPSSAVVMVAAVAFEMLKSGIPKLL